MDKRYITYTLDHGLGNIPNVNLKHAKGANVRKQHFPSWVFNSYAREKFTGQSQSLQLRC